MKFRNLKKSTQILSIALIVVLVAGFAFAGLVWTANHEVKIISTQGTPPPSSVFSFTTTVTGVQMYNVGQAITIDGVSYTESTITEFSSTTSGYFGSDSVVSLPISNVLDTGFVYFEITVTNTGTAPISLTTYSISCYFCSANGTILSTQPIINGVQTTPYYLIDESLTTANFGSDTLYTDQVLLNGTEFGTTWLNDNSYSPGIGTTMPTTLASEATFTYYLFTGLGYNAEYPIDDQFYSITIPITYAVPS